MEARPGMGDIDSRMIGLAVAIGLGLLVGLQREIADKRIGLRSFALISTIGAMAGMLLHWKTPMHSWVERIGSVELGAIGRFVSAST